MNSDGFANETSSLYQAGQYCRLGTFEVESKEVSCCFPCPIQDWVYAPEWQNRLRIPNYLSIISALLCSFLLVSFLTLPAARSHRHYLSTCLLISVLLISLSFAIPVSTQPSYCYDAITPADMHTSMSCAWTGSLIALGGLGCVVWVFLHSLWLFIRIVYDIALGRKFMFGSIAAGTLFPVAFLVAVLTSTGFSYRIGPTCLPNHENAVITFWIWLIVFATLGFVLQAATTGYCIWVFLRTLKLERSTPRHYLGYGQSTNQRVNLQTWLNVKRLFVLQWRNILVSVFVLAGNLVFFIVFWTQDFRLEKVFNNPVNLKHVKRWIVCQTLSSGDKTECRKYVEDFMIDEVTVLISRILFSMIGIGMFILLFRASMLSAWRTLFKRLFRFNSYTRAPTPELTSAENPDKYSLLSVNPTRSGSRFIETFEAPKSPRGLPIQDTSVLTSPRLPTPLPIPSSPLASSPPTAPPPRNPVRNPARPCQPLLPQTSSMSSCPASSLWASSSVLPSPPVICVTSHNQATARVSSHISPPISPMSPILPPNPLMPRLKSHRHSFVPSASARNYQPSRRAPCPPQQSEIGPQHPCTALVYGFGYSTSKSVFSCISCGTRPTERTWRDSTISALEKVANQGERESGVDMGRSTDTGNQGRRCPDSEHEAAIVDEKMSVFGFWDDGCGIERDT
ncbi:hypothetical protein FB567DRAFT_569390 [Paraphoma chrysanthemicola]|uniref:G-protein coupled receptors family 2 profile 2 domain-containing protein n=1 Tax=Paraphoma chrysanthemicola TaxID=798071 RepID=A0A8K0VZD3_9PLEO|nr:hypothetical protein FB567DRAFT_569390 [Paraphoma chrysanthemicola]